MYDLKGIEDGTINVERLSLDELAGAMGAAIRSKNLTASQKIAPVLERKSRQIQAGSQPIGDGQRALFNNYIDKIEDTNLKELISSGKIRVMRFVLYSVNLIAAQTTADLFSTGRSRSAGLTNINNAKLEKDNAFLITAFRLQTGIAAGETDADAKTAAFATPSNEVLNGHFTFKVGTETFFERCSNQVFKNATTEQSGLYILDTPILTNPGRDISFNIETGATPAANTFARIDLVGLMTIKKAS